MMRDMMRCVRYLCDTCRSLKARDSTYIGQMTQVGVLHLPLVRFLYSYSNPNPFNDLTECSKEANKRKIRIRTATQKHVEMNQSNAVRKRHRYSYSNSLMPVPYQMNAAYVFLYPYSKPIIIL